MIELECGNCGSRDKFIVTCLYKYIVNSHGKEITTMDMDEEPEYQCEKCGFTNIKINVLL